MQDNRKSMGLAEFLFIQCKHCGAEQSFTTSRKIPGKGGAFEINRRAILACPSRNELQAFCTKMNLPLPVHKEAYNNHLKQIEQEVILEAEVKMNQAASRLKDIIKAEDPDRVKTIVNGKEIAEVAVSVDGTWQKRGHSSKFGVVFVLSIRTGEVLDYEVLSHFCQECNSHNQNVNTVEYREWKGKHEPVCQINHFGSAGDMESKSAIAIFRRSMEKRGLKYTKFIGDGDSSCFGRVVGALKASFGDSYSVEKEECVGHIKERMGSALLEYKKSKKGLKLADGKSVGGAGRLTQDVIKRIQNYYGLAIRQNKGNLPSMKKAVNAILHHVVIDAKKKLSEQHGFCPQGKESWCRHWRDVANASQTYNETHRLPAVFFTELQPIFKRLGESELLKRCLLGLTQNQNESLNSRLWSLVPKSRFCGKRRVTIGVCETICDSNTGAGSKSVIMKRLGIEAGKNTLSGLWEEDAMSLKNAAKKIQAKYRNRRRRLRFEKKKRTPKEVVYKAGSFGVGIEQETGRKGSKGKKKVQWK